MDEHMFALTLFVLIVSSPILFLIYQYLSDSGKLYGEWIKKENTHDCHLPATYMAESGDVWQCRKCGKAWTFGRFYWE